MSDTNLFDEMMSPGVSLRLKAFLMAQEIVGQPPGVTVDRNGNLDNRLSKLYLQQVIMMANQIMEFLTPRSDNGSRD